MEVFRSFIESAVNNFEDYVILPRQEYVIVLKN